MKVKQLELQEIANVIDSLHITPKYETEYKDTYPMVRATEIQGGFLRTTDALRVSADVYEQFTKKHKPIKGDIVMTRVGSYLGKSSYVIDNIPFCLGQNTVVIYPTNINSRFLYYYFQSDLIRNQIDAQVGGSSQKTLSLKSIRSLKINVPCKTIQKRIGEILGFIDEKIELNQRMNQTLEDMAITLYQYWFVDFGPFQEGEFEDSELGLIPKGWGINYLNSLLHKTIGGDWGKEQPSEQFSQSVFCIRGADIPKIQKGIRPDIPKRYIKSTSAQKRILKDGDLVIEVSGGSPTQSTGRPVLINRILVERYDSPIVCSNFCRILKPVSIVHSNFLYLHFLFLYRKDEFFNYENGTTGIKNLNINALLNDRNFVLPPKDVLDKFNAQVENWFNQIQQNGIENDALSQIRDYLLPRLLSGEIELKEAEKQVEEVL